jgi:hypothetical protein
MLKRLFILLMLCAAVIGSGRVAFAGATGPMAQMQSSADLSTLSSSQMQSMGDCAEHGYQSSGQSQPSAPHHTTNTCPVMGAGCFPPAIDPYRAMVRRTLAPVQWRPWPMGLQQLSSIALLPDLRPPRQLL